MKHSYIFTHALKQEAAQEEIIEESYSKAIDKLIEEGEEYRKYYYLLDIKPVSGSPIYCPIPNSINN